MIRAVLIKKKVVFYLALFSAEMEVLLSTCLHEALRGSIVKTPLHWKQRFPDSFLREYCKWSEIITDIEDTDHILILSDYGC